MRLITRRRWMFLLLAASVALVAAPAREAQELPKIAGYAYGAKDPALSRAAATRLVTAFVNSGRYKASEEYREFFEYAADGHAVSPKSTTPISVTQFKLMGQQFGIDYICVAEIATIFGEERIFAHLVEVKTATIIAMAAGDTPLRKPLDLTTASKQIVETMLKIASAAPTAAAIPKVAPPPPTALPYAKDINTADTTDHKKHRKPKSARNNKN